MTKTEPNAGYAEGIGKRSKARQLSYALKGAPMRQKDLKLNSVAAVAEGRKLRDKVSALMLNAEANPADAMVYCVFATPDLSAFKPAEMSLTNGPSDIALAMQYVDTLPIGFLVFVWDKTDSEVFGHFRPLIVEDPRAEKLNRQALDKVASLIKQQIQERN